MCAAWNQVMYSLLVLPVLLVIFVMFQSEQSTQGYQQPIEKAPKKVFADLTSNKLTREHDGSFGMWSYHGIAKKSHAKQTEFIYNADLLSQEGDRHTNIASTVYPLMGLTSDMDPIYQEYLILQAKTIGIDGFILEWGYQQHPSNTALLSLLKVAAKYKPFNIAINWCDHWLTMHMMNKSSEEIVDAFHTNLQYLYDSVFSIYKDLIPMHGNHPIIFFFGGGLTALQFAEVLKRPLHLPAGLDTPVWIGSYLNFASTQKQWSDWKDFINGTYGWVDNIRRPTPPSMSEWDFYSTTDDTVRYQLNVSSAGSDCVSHLPGCVMWCGSVSPGMDNRGCAGWGGALRYVPRQNATTHKMTNDIQWEFYLTSKKQPDVMILPTMNDFPEATTILPLENSSFTALYSTAHYAAVWKNSTIDTKGVTIPTQWFTAYKEVQFYSTTPKLNASGLFPLLDEAAVFIGKQDYAQANDSLQNIRNGLSKLQQSLTIIPVNISGPSKDLFPTVPPVSVGNATFIDIFKGLFLSLAENYAGMLQTHNYKGLLKFEYQLLEPQFSHLIVKSSSKRKSLSSDNAYVIHSRSTQLPPGGKPFEVNYNFAEVCDLMTKTAGVWNSAVVALYKQNQAWDHSGEHDSDLHFGSDAAFLIRNITVSLEVYKLKNLAGR